MKETDPGASALPAEAHLRLNRIDLLVLALYVALVAIWFSPVLLSGKLLAPGDGLNEYVPNYLAHSTLWEPALGTGYPAAADPLTFTWYPPAFLLSWIPGSYNLFVLSAYVLASWFTYLLAFTLTGSRFAGWISGILYGLSGFLMAHAGHPSITHSAAWIPAVLLGLERMRRTPAPAWFAFGCFATGGLVLSGHPQIVLYGLLFAVAYAVARAWSEPVGRRTYLIRAGLILVFGIGIGSILFVPLLEFSRLTVRQTVSLEFFNFARFPIRSIPILLFPYLFGGEDGSIYEESFQPFSTEHDAFLGFLTLTLAVFALLRNRKAGPVWFLSAAALTSLFCSFGTDTPLGTLLFHLAPFNQFRCQGRFLVVFQLAMALLAGFGVKALLRDFPLRRAAAWAGIFLLLQTTAALTISYLGGPRLTKLAASLGVPNVSFAVTQPAFLVPLACSLAAALAMVWLARSRTRALPVAALTLAALADMGQFGLFASWRYYSIDRNQVDAPPTAQLVRSGTGRSVAIRGFTGKPAELPPNTSKLWGIQSLNKYGSLSIERYQSLAGMDPGGTVSGPWWNPQNRALDILGAHYILLPDADIGEMDRFQGVPLPSEDLSADLGERRTQSFRGQAAFAVDSSKRFTTLAMVSFLRDSVHITQGTPVAEIRLRGEAGHDIVIPVLAGQETAEFLAGCPAVRGSLQHQAATIWKKVGAAQDGVPCEGNFYFARWPLPVDQHFSNLEVKWRGAEGGMNLAKVVLWNRESGAIQAISPADSTDPGSRFQLLRRGQMTRVYENRRVLPRAWLVQRVLPTPAEFVKRAIQTSILPDGTAFDPATTALVEARVSEPLRHGTSEAGATAIVVRSENTAVDVRTHSGQAALLVLADLYYPGWSASINGHPAKIRQTNFVQRGVEVPAGDNLVRFTFRPGSLYLGIGIALASLAGIAITCTVLRRARL